MSPLKGGTLPCFEEKVQSSDRGCIGEARLVESPSCTSPSLPVLLCRNASFSQKTGLHPMLFLAMGRLAGGS